MLAPQAGDDTTILGIDPGTLPACVNQPTCTATLPGGHWGKATLRVHFTSTATGEQVTADARLIVVQINSVVAVVTAHVGADMNKTFPTAVPQGQIQWPYADLFGGATPLILIRDGLSGVSLYANTMPPTTDPEMTGAVQYKPARAPDDVVGADLPTIDLLAFGGGTLHVNQTGSFQIVAFIDSNANGTRENTRSGSLCR